MVPVQLFKFPIHSAWALPSAASRMLAQMRYTSTSSVVCNIQQKVWQNVLMKESVSASFTACGQPNQQRHLWQWVCAVFNKVSRDRIKEVGPDRACAEWLLRNGASVQWMGKSEFVTDYNALPLRGAEKGRYLIKSVDATDSSIMAIGFPHFKGCNNIEKIVMKNCNYLDDEALPQLSVLKTSLKTLEIIRCLNLTSEGVLSLAALSNLSRLKLETLPEVKNKAEVKGKLMSALPNCNITFDETENDDDMKT